MNDLSRRRLLVVGFWKIQEPWKGEIEDLSLSASHAGCHPFATERVILVLGQRTGLGVPDSFAGGSHNPGDPRGVRMLDGLELERGGEARTRDWSNLIIRPLSR